LLKFFYNLFLFKNKKINLIDFWFIIEMGIGDWGLGIGDW